MKEKKGHLVILAQVLILLFLCVRQGMIKEKQKENEVSPKEVVQQAGIGLNKNTVNTARPKAAEEKKKAALTFDDGPNSKYTPMLLEGLKERGVHATFFLLGKNIEGKEELVRQMQEEGHLIGNHTYNHVELNKITKEAAKKEIEATNREIYDITGQYPAWLRPPYGEWQKNLDFYVTMFPVLWDIDTLDWKSQNVNEILQIVESEIQDGAVILMHDAYQTSVDAALQIADMLVEMGYELVTVDKLVLP